MLISAPFDGSSPRNYRIALGTVPGEFDVIEIGYNIVPKGFRQVMKRDVYILHYITKGQGTFCGQPISKGCGYLVCPEETEIVVADGEEPYEAYWIMVKNRSFSNVLKLCGLGEHNCVFPFEKTQECAQILKKTLFEMYPTNEYEEAAQMNGALYQIIALHLGQLQSIPVKSKVSETVKRFIDANYSKNIKIESLAKEFHFNRSYLYTLFIKDYGISPQRYIVSLRMEKAKDMLQQGCSVKDVASAVGYEDPLYFSRLFRKKTGFSPKQFSMTAVGKADHEVTK